MTIPNKHKGKPGDIKTAARLAQELGVSAASVSRWMTDGSWTFGTPPWTGDIVGLVRDWSANDYKVREQDSKELRALRKQRMQADVESAKTRSRRERLELDRELTKVIKIDELQRVVENFASEVGRVLQKVVDQFPDSEAIIVLAVKEARARFKKNVAGLCKRK